MTGVYAKLDQEKLALQLKKDRFHFSLFRTPSLGSRVDAIDNFQKLTNRLISGQYELKGCDINLLKKSYETLQKGCDETAHIARQLTDIHNLFASSDESKIKLDDEQPSKTFSA